MNGNILVDTDVVVDFLRGIRQAEAYFNTHVDAICFSAITVAEIYAGTRDGEEGTVARLFNSFPVFAVSTDIAREAGILANRYRRSHALDIPDATIAATCLEKDAELCTLNVKHFPMFKGLKPPYRKH